MEEDKCDFCGDFTYCSSIKNSDIVSVPVFLLEDDDNVFEIGINNNPDVLSNDGADCDVEIERLDCSEEYSIRVDFVS